MKIKSRIRYHLDVCQNHYALAWVLTRMYSPNQQEQGLESKIEKMKAVEEQTRSQLQNIHESQVEAFKSQIKLLEGKIADLEILCVEKEESINELNQAIEELEQEQGQELKSVQDAHNLKMIELQNEQKAEVITPC